MIDAMEVGVEVLALPVVDTVDDPLCATFIDTVKFRGCNLSASPEFHLTNTGLLVRYLVRPSPLACNVNALPFRVSVKAPDSAATERKSVVVGFVTRFVEPLVDGEPPT